MSKTRIVLGIESSCDETGIALLECTEGSPESTILAEAVHSQVQLHRDYGGVVPELAAREHLTNLPLILEEVFQQSERTLADVDLIGVTCGPGLKGCLLTGMLFASGVSAASNIPLVPVNHVEAHVLSLFLDHPDLTFPFLSLIVSGGHTELHLVHGIGNYSLLARTTDDAAGEAFDKSAKLLNLPYPGGPHLARLADTFEGRSDLSLPKVMRNQPGFSFSGLKTAIAQLIKKSYPDPSEAQLRELCAVIQESIVEVLHRKVMEAVRAEHCTTVTVCGGVSANDALRKKLTTEAGITCLFPRLTHSMDNGTMIALTAHLRAGRAPSACSLPEAKPRWPIETLTPIAVGEP